MNCESLEKCGFFHNFNGNTEVVMQGWVRLYCEDQEKSERCVRKQIRKATGAPPVDNMAPTGKLLG